MYLKNKEDDSWIERLCIARSNKPWQGRSVAGFTEILSDDANPKNDPLTLLF
jgi:hypothetical protein